LLLLHAPRALASNASAIPVAALFSVVPSAAYAARPARARAARMEHVIELGLFPADPNKGTK